MPLLARLRLRRFGVLPLLWLGALMLGLAPGRACPMVGSHGGHAAAVATTEAHHDEHHHDAPAPEQTAPCTCIQHCTAAHLALPSAPMALVGQVVEVQASAGSAVQSVPSPTTPPRYLLPYPTAPPEVQTA